MDMMLYKKLFFIILFSLVIAIFGVAMWAAFYFAEPDPAGPSEYSAVYLSSRDIYYGKVRWFPSFHLAGAWYLQQGGQGGVLAIQSFEDAFWKPVDKLYLNSREVLWRARLRNDSPLVKAFRNPQSVSSAPEAPAPVLPLELVNETENTADEKSGTQ